MIMMMMMSTKGKCETIRKFSYVLRFAYSETKSAQVIRTKWLMEKTTVYNAVQNSCVIIIHNFNPK